jgi:SOUL heme-binding protein
MIQRRKLPLALLGTPMFSWLLAFGPTARAETPLPQGYIEEAPLPEGFPPPSEVGKIVEKEYPLARSYSATGRGQFMKCFAYLSLRKHKMTAPVVMEYQANKQGEKNAARDNEDLPVEVDRMHFLLENISQDEPKKAALVVVADMPKMRVLSVAHQGRLSAEIVEDAEKKLAQELKARPELVAAGAARILGYNGPSVRDEKLFWEIQLPVKASKE